MNNTPLARLVSFLVLDLFYFCSCSLILTYIHVGTGSFPLEFGNDERLF
jgi:hypothetical protein